MDCFKNPKSEQVRSSENLMFCRPGTSISTVKTTPSSVQNPTSRLQKTRRLQRRRRLQISTSSTWWLHHPHLPFRWPRWLQRPFRIIWIWVRWRRQPSESNSSHVFIRTLIFSRRDHWYVCRKRNPSCSTTMRNIFRLLNHLEDRVHVSESQTSEDVKNLNDRGHQLQKTTFRRRRPNSRSVEWSWSRRSMRKLIEEGRWIGLRLLDIERRNALKRWEERGENLFFFFRNLCRKCLKLTWNLWKLKKNYFKIFELFIYLKKFERINFQKLEKNFFLKKIFLLDFWNPAWINKNKKKWFPKKFQDPKKKIFF